MKLNNVCFSEAFGGMLPNLKSGGAFLVVDDAANGTKNPMTIGWCTCGVVWGKNVCTVLVRESRYTHELMEQSDIFTISAPGSFDMKKELAYCGSRSGREGSKLAALGMETQATENGGTLICGCQYHIVCRKLQKSECDMNDMYSDELLSRFYASGDPHTVYFGEILEAFRSE